MATHFSTALGIGLLIAALNQPSSCDSATVRGASQSVASDGRLQKETADLVFRIRRADYEGDRTALRALFDALSPAADRSDRSFASRVHY